MRSAFRERLFAILDHFSLQSFGGDAVVVQMMNDFPEWLPTELDLVADLTGIEKNTILDFYVRSYRLFREKRLAEQKPVIGRAQVLHGKIREIEGQEWEQPKQQRWEGKWTPPQMEEAPPPPHGTFNGKPMNEDEEKLMEELFTSFGQSPKARAEFQERLRKARENSEQKRQQQAQPPNPESNPFWEHFAKGAGSAGGTAGARTEQAGPPPPWAKAPGYLHHHLKILNQKWPCSYEEAQKNYRDIAKKIHPDIAKDDGSKFKALKAAWDEVGQYLKYMTK